MKKFTIIFMLLVTLLFGNDINNLYDESMMLAEKISELEQIKIKNLMKEIGQNYDSSKNYIISERGQGHFQINTLAPDNYKTIIKNNSIEDLEFLTRITLIFYEENNFYFMIESGMLDAIMGDSIVIDLMGTYEEISNMIKSLEEETGKS
jgi:hypothetical protein